MKVYKKPPIEIRNMRVNEKRGIWSFGRDIGDGCDGVGFDQHGDLVFVYGKEYGFYVSENEKYQESVVVSKSHMAAFIEWLKQGCKR